MKRRKLFQATTGGIALFSALVFEDTARAQPTSPATPARQSEYLFWLPEVDRSSAKAAAALALAQFDQTPLEYGRIAGVYQRGSAALKKRTNEVKFAKRVIKYREGLGLLRDRVLQGVEGGFKVLPGNVDGQYAIVTFDTMFALSSDIYTEQLTIGRESMQGAQWQIVDYYLAAKPFYTF